MNKFNEVNINIKKALITGINIELKAESKVEVSVSGQLLTEQGNPVSNFSFSTNSWYDESRQIEIPVDVHMQIGEIFRKMTPVIYAKLNDMYKQLPAKTKNQKSVEPDEDIPF